MKERGKRGGRKGEREEQREKQGREEQTGREEGREHTKKKKPLQSVVQTDSLSWLSFCMSALNHSLSDSLSNHGR